MGEYFKPLRRKFGGLTLMLACVFAGLWVNSLTRAIAVGIPGADRHDFVRLSHDGLAWEAWTSIPESVPANERLRSGWIVTGRVVNSDPFSSFDTTWRFRFLGVQVGKCSFLGQPITVLVVPYTAIAIPLTLISAWLLLSKPRILKPGKS